MAKISDMQKQGMSCAPDGDAMPEPEAEAGIEAQKMRNVIPTEDEYGDMYGRDMRGFFLEGDLAADACLGEDLPGTLSGLKFAMEENSFRAGITYFRHMEGIECGTPEPQEMTYEAEREGVRWYYSMRLDRAVGRAETYLLRILPDGRVQRYSTDGRIFDDEGLMRLFDVMREDWEACSYIVDTHRRMDMSILMSDPIQALGEADAAGPLMDMERKLDGCATIKTLFMAYSDPDAYDMSDPDVFHESVIPVLAASDPMMSGTGVTYSNGTYSLCRLYAPYEEDDGLILFDMDAEQDGDHLWEVVYETEDPGEILPMLQEMWNRPNRGSRWFVAPLSDSSFIAVGLDLMRISISTANDDGNLTDVEKSELSRLKALLGVEERK